MSRRRSYSAPASRPPGRIRINEEVLAEVAAAMAKIAGRLQVQPPTLDGILSIRGVIETADAELTRRRASGWRTLIT